MADPDALIGQTVSHYRIIRVGSASRRMELYAAKYPGKYFVFDCSERNTIADSDLLRSVNGTASKCKTFLATATEECCPARGTLAGHFTRRLSPSPMPGKRIQQQRAYLPLKRSSPRPQFYRSTRTEATCPTISSRVQRTSSRGRRIPRSCPCTTAAYASSRALSRPRRPSARCSLREHTPPTSASFPFGPSIRAGCHRARQAPL